MIGSTGSTSVSLDRQTVVRLARVLRSFATSDVARPAAVSAGLLIALLLAINGLNVVNSFVGRDFMTAIEQRDYGGFVTQALRYVAVFALSTLAAVIYRFTEERLGLLWRVSLTRRLTSIYLDGHFYYDLHTAGRLANPDQRIADDVRTFTTTTLSLSLIFLNGTLTVIAFSGVLWSISRPLFATAVLYAVLGSLIAYRIGRPLVRLNYDQSDREADFRSQLVHVRSNAESIAVAGFEPQLASRLDEQVAALAANLKRIIAVNRNLGFFSTGYNYMIQLIPALVVAPLFIRGSVEFGVIPQSAMAFAQVIGAFSLIVNQFPQLSSYAAVLARLNALGEARDALSAAPGAGIVAVEDDSKLVFEQLTLAGLGDRTLVRDLSFSVPVSAHLLIATPDDMVSNALLHALTGLAARGSGRVVRPHPGDAMIVVPERPYLPPGPLRAWFGGRGRQASTDGRVADVLRLLGVEAAIRRVGGLDVEHDWNAAFALDEQRLIGVAHALLAEPQLVVLIQPTATLGPAAAATVFAALRERGIGYVVLADSEPSRDPFDVVIDIAADGTWTRTDLAAS